MVKRRVQVQDLQGPQQLTPQARPVDTYYLPQEKAVAPPARTNGFLQLAEALRSVQPGIDRFVDTKIDQIRESEHQKGAAAAVKNKQGFNEAIKSNLIPPGASPWFRMGFQQERLRTIGEEFDIQLREAYAQSGAKGSGKLEDFSKFLTEQKNALFQQLGDEFDNRDIQDVLVPSIQKSETHLFSEHVNNRVKQIEIDAKDNVKNQVFALLDQYYNAGVNDDERVKILSQLGVLHSDLGKRTVSSGLPGTETNQIMADAIGQYALTHEDPDVLEVLDHVDTGNGILGKTGYSQTVAGKIADQIADLKERRERFQWAKEDRDRAEKIDTLQSAIMLKIIQDPTVDVTSEAKVLALLDPEKARAIISFQDARLDAQTTVRDDPHTVNILQAGIYSGRTAQNDIISASLNNKVSPQTAGRLLNTLFDFKQDTTTRTILDNDYVHRTLQNMRSAIMKGDGFGGFDNDSILRANMAEIRFTNSIQQFTKQNQNYTDEQLFKYLNEVYQSIVSDPIYTDSSLPLPGASQSSPAPKPKPTPARSTPQAGKSKAPEVPKYTSVAQYNAAVSSGELERALDGLGIPANNRAKAKALLKRQAEIQEQLKVTQQKKQDALQNLKRLNE